MESGRGKPQDSDPRALFSSKGTLTWSGPRALGGQSKGQPESTGTCKVGFSETEGSTGAEGWLPIPALLLPPPTECATAFTWEREWIHLL